MIDKGVFDSIIQITRHRDLDSLDVGFVRILESLFPVTSASLFRLPKEDQVDSVEEIIYLAGGGDEPEIIHSWINESRVLELDHHLESVLESGNHAIHDADEGQRLVIPVVASGRMRGAVALVSNQDWRPSLDMVQGVVEVYANYMSVLQDSERDNLTGLLNRRTFDNKLFKLLDAQRHSKDACPYSQVHHERRQADQDAYAWLAIMDIDHFKRINDTYGHVYGDEILLRLAHRMRESFRKVDLLFRVGGEEFVIVLAPESADKARISLERFRAHIEAQGVPQFDGVTVSIGYSRLEDGDYPRQVYDLADKALYHAKENGRNQICCYQDLVSTGQIVEEDTSGSIELF